jgi:hypothetical protein
MKKLIINKPSYREFTAALLVFSGVLVGVWLASVSRAADVKVTVDTDILDPVNAVVEKTVEPILTEVILARQAIEEMKRIGEDAIKIEEAIRNLTTLEIRLENARVKAAAQGAGLSVDEISTMRKQGIGWGVIAQELGIHPGSLGVGHAKGSPPTIKTPKSKVKIKGKGKVKTKQKGKK